MHRAYIHAISAIAAVLAVAGGTYGAPAAELDLALRLEQYRPGCSGPAQWAQMYPVPQRDGLLAGG